MPYVSENPYTGRVAQTYLSWTHAQLEAAIAAASRVQAQWAQAPFSERAKLMTQLANSLRAKREEYARLITAEMGKPLREARAEIDKCALVCDYYAVHGGLFLEEEAIRTDAGRSYVTYLPLGTVLGVMPWTFPFWQVLRFASAALVAGNACIVKPASNVAQCALAVEAVVRESGFPDGLFTAALIEPELVEAAIENPHVHAVTVTGSQATGRAIAQLAGKNLKKCVLELGGSDAFIVLADADLELAASQAVASRYINCGQSSTASKRFVVVPEIADRFVDLFKQRASELTHGDPLRDGIALGPMARKDLRDELHRQVTDAISRGAVPALGCEPRDGSFYPASILDRVTPAMRVYREEVFGPVASIIRAQHEADAIRIANDSVFGLGSSLWTQDPDRADELVDQIQSGATFINGIVRSDPRLPFGGIKQSGFGRELSYHGVREFTNAKTVWMREGYTGAERRLARERRQGDRRQTADDFSDE
jgi:succinate-semialdehyde dehydrogenase / glutarate-semialdehyde dehydrogenase